MELVKIKHYSRQLSLKVVVPACLLFFAVVGCNSNDVFNVNLEKQTSDLYQIYLTAGHDDARSAVQQAIQLIEVAHFPPKDQEQQTKALFLGYGRLYALDYRSGSNDWAQVDLVKARYWALRSEELHGDNQAECIAYLGKYATDGKVIDFIDKWDKKANNGKGPNYIQYLNSTRQQ